MKKQDNSYKFAGDSLKDFERNEELKKAQQDLENAYKKLSRMKKWHKFVLHSMTWLGYLIALFVIIFFAVIFGYGIAHWLMCTVSWWVSLLYILAVSAIIATYIEIKEYIKIKKSEKNTDEQRQDSTDSDEGL